MPKRVAPQPDPGTIMGRLKQSLEEIGRELTGPGRGGLKRRAAIDEQVDDAVIGRRRENQSTDSNN